MIRERLAVRPISIKHVGPPPRCGVSHSLFRSPRQNAVAEYVDLKAPRGLDKALFQKLVAGDWIDRHHNLLIIGPTGVGKCWIACALAHKACCDDRSVLYQRLPRLLDALRSRVVTAATKGSSRAWPASSFSSSTIGDWRQ